MNTPSYQPCTAKPSSSSVAIRLFVERSDNSSERDCLGIRRARRVGQCGLQLVGPNRKRGRIEIDQGVALRRNRNDSRLIASGQLYFDANLLRAELFDADTEAFVGAVDERLLCFEHKWRQDQLAKAQIVDPGFSRSLQPDCQVGRLDFLADGHASPEP